MRTTEEWISAALAFALSTAAMSVCAESWRIGTGIDYTSGDYGGDADITTTYAPVNIRYRGERVGVRLTIPYLQVDGPGSVVDAEGQLVPGSDRTESGLGDVILGASLYDVIRLPAESFYVDITAKVKFGTADEDKGLGTGEADYALQADWNKNFDVAGFFGSVGYKFYGDPDGYSLDNAVFASVGADYRLTRSTHVGLIYDYRESAIAADDALQELILFTSFAGRSISVQPYLLTGLSYSSPDWGGGIMIGWRAQRW